MFFKSRNKVTFSPAARLSSSIELRHLHCTHCFGIGLLLALRKIYNQEGCHPVKETSTNQLKQPAQIKNNCSLEQKLCFLLDWFRRCTFPPRSCPPPKEGWFLHQAPEYRMSKVKLEPRMFLCQCEHFFKSVYNHSCKHENKNRTYDSIVNALLRTLGHEASSLLLMFFGGKPAF